ncbi:MAG: hypothetical protein HYV68_00470 [Candidatus Taylorbacteria bacterium]|nr:hypothetical protein [Candidatus Taylorbacteria bacterium]
MELLIVIAVVGILSSVVFVSVSHAKLKAKDAVVRSTARQMEKLLLLDYAETGNYFNLQICEWIPYTYTCSDAPFQGGYAEDFRKLCEQLMLYADPGGFAMAKFWSCNAVDNDQKYSITTFLNTGGSEQLCVGSGGLSESSTNWWNSTINGSSIEANPARWGESPAGCYYNP